MTDDEFAEWLPEAFDEATWINSIFGSITVYLDSLPNVRWVKVQTRFDDHSAWQPIEKFGWIAVER